MQIINSTMEDIDTIFDLYDAGTAYQKRNATRHWKGFDREMVAREIAGLRQWKILEEGVIVCVFATTFQDPNIWQEKDLDPSLYIHRIATHPDYRGKGYVKQIVAWAKAFAKTNNREYLRLDTGSGNEKLNAYYISCGFNYLGIVRTDSPELPAHYQNATFSLFEIKL
ncbi:acetyltransferase (GNAT) family protein [Chitinophaga dinghuensis]|uniref:Acetyltransferase (GNAT) family protein n=1 Tax=Chitinophaga dinghuensis TaxID=1539050 RepID=A0A327VZY3_9BACT|nr:GNAT family N-acetyltransferase [Chitinophaga dinghuensis]RAJ80314.1 acetyltransferase (GNAT) family protein [Chitinophaga dinghuensis]